MKIRFAFHQGLYDDKIATILDPVIVMQVT